MNTNISAPFNLALEEVLAHSAADELFMLWRNGPSVIIGRNQVTLAEVDMDYLRSHSISLVRRMTGGGAVYHDLGNVNFTYISAPGALHAPDFSLLAAPIVRVLRSFGVAASFSGRNDMLVDGAKFSGCAQSMVSGRILFHGTLLFDADLSVLSSVLKPDPSKITSKRISSVRSRVVNLRKYLSFPDTEAFVSELALRLANELDSCGVSEIPQELISKAESLSESKYSTDEWNFNNSPSFTYVRKARYPFGGVSLELSVADGVMTHVRISGDFFGARPVDELESFLCGRMLCEARPILLNIDTGEYIASSVPQDIIALLP